MKPLLLDLFCGAGGCSAGYSRAGFDVVGVDNRPQPNYPFPFIQGDALELLADPDFMAQFDAIAASPPCQHYSQATAWRGDRDNHPDLIGPTRDLLIATGLPYVIENVEGARHELRRPIMLCGSDFGLRVQRHRFFETNWPLRLHMAPCRHVGLLPFEHKGERAYADAMGCEWMSSKEARQAIPPAFTQAIGAQLLEHLQALRSAA